MILWVKKVITKCMENIISKFARIFFDSVQQFEYSLFEGTGNFLRQVINVPMYLSTYHLQLKYYKYSWLFQQKWTLIIHVDRNLIRNTNSIKLVFVPTAVPKLVTQNSLFKCCCVPFSKRSNWFDAFCHRHPKKNARLFPLTRKLWHRSTTCIPAGVL